MLMMYRLRVLSRLVASVSFKGKLRISQPRFSAFPTSVLNLRRSTAPRQKFNVLVYSTVTSEYESCSDETLESLCEKFDELLESDSRMSKADATLASGVLTVIIPSQGTYVINKQSPNQQIWLSSPISGPSRFDLVMSKGWVNRRTDETLHTLLDREIGQYVLQKEECGFQNCYFADGQLEN